MNPISLFELLSQKNLVRLSCKMTLNHLLSKFFEISNTFWSHSVFIPCWTLPITLLGHWTKNNGKVIFVTHTHTNTHTYTMVCVVYFHGVGFSGWVSCFRHLSSFFLLFKLEMLSMSPMSRYYDGGICPIWDLLAKVGQNIKLCLFDKANVFNALIYQKQEWLSQRLLSLLEILIILKIEFLLFLFFRECIRMAKKNIWFWLLL